MPASHSEQHVLVKTQLPFLISVKPPSDFFWKTNLCLQPAPSRSGPAAGTMQRLCRSSALHSLWLSSCYLRRHCSNFSALTASHFGIYNAPLWKWSWDRDPGHADVMFLTHNQDHSWVGMSMTAQEPSATSSSSVLSVEYNSLPVIYSRQGLKSVSLFEEQELKALFPWRCSLSRSSSWLQKGRMSRLWKDDIVNRWGRVWSSSNSPRQRPVWAETSSQSSSPPAWQKTGSAVFLRSSVRRRRMKLPHSLSSH